ncbi:carboxylesteras-like protein [Amniculicola lignicola CBS 123094]|uniref:Carboxylic ester hydrolase n=1 Tax=Amniculicola lignicola CBS 123094 TaxID=1392246 RepID=A0A6A5X309_9PLEO|nr:carboxylesteras-like protein [Amniculicola lignicola CBS 123094]
MFLHTSFLLLTAITCPLPHTSASPISTTTSDLTVPLDYITLGGAYSSTYNLTYYRRIPFGASTAGPNRFRAPQPPVPILDGTYDTDRPFDMCVQRTVNGSEDCLYLGVYSRPWSSSKPLRPVLLTFYGGGFIQGSATFTIPPSGFPVLNVSETNDYVVVYSNYRTNLFGFLSGAKIEAGKDVDLNTGLLDQQAALEWIQKYIHKFGGDSKNVTIWGQSAGGGSVVAQTIATGNAGKKLFKKAMASSPYWPKTYRYNAPENEDLYAQVVNATGCANASAKDEIACLKTADVQVLRDINLKLAASHTYTTSSYTWGPVIDTSFLSVPLSTAIRKNNLNAEFVMASYNLHEGETFVQSSVNFDTWLPAFLPNLTSKDIDKVKTLYPQNGTAEEVTWTTASVRAGMVYRDLILACPAYWLSDTAKRGSLIEYTISPAKHASDTIYWNQLNAVQQSDPLTYNAYAGAMASFFQTGDPNAHKVTNASVPGVPAVGKDEQFVIRAGGPAQGKIDMLQDRCEFWLKIAERVPI